MLLLLLTACSRDPENCTPFQEMEVTDPDGLASEWERYEVWMVIDQMAAAAGVGGVCVPTLQIVGDGTCESGGSCYQGPDAPILVEDTWSYAVRPAMCDALVETLDLKVPGDVFETSLLGGSATLSSVCAHYPGQLDLYGATDDSCLAVQPITPEQARWTLDTLFPRWPNAGRTHVRMSRHAVSGLSGDLGSFVWSGDAFYAWERIDVDSDLLDDRVIRIDPDTFSVTGRWSIPVQTTQSYHEVVPSDAAPLLVYAEEDLPTRAWRLGEVGWDALPDVPGMEEGRRFSAVASGETMWVVGSPAEDKPESLRAVDLTSGVVMPFVGSELDNFNNLTGG